MLAIIGKILLLCRAVRRRLFRFFLRPLFASHGRNFVFDPDGFYTYSTISVGDDVYIGQGAHLAASETTITIGNKVLLGPGVTLLGGDHNTSLIGRYMFDVKEKLPENDQPIRIEDDVWICANATLMKGVVVGRGAIVAAGALVTKSVVPYAVVGGVPARVLRMRWTAEEIVKHEELLRTDGRLA
jgi:acetyltransferase-like isoleucine patch superfamily enzyme